MPLSVLVNRPTDRFWLIFSRFKQECNGLLTEQISDKAIDLLGNATVLEYPHLFSPKKKKKIPSPLILKKKSKCNIFFNFRTIYNYYNIFLTTKKRLV